LSAFY